MNQAMSRLLQHHMILTDIAEEIEFASPYAFSATLKREVGRSPAQFPASLFGSWRETAIR